ncbi:PrgI family protein [Candidatus Parcubacteria bacterium]|nr:PrgI family protein [Candidatus Parcubacteria bacterium]MBI4099237.1 PrgI family protein [Candidatus Parcubacteria bacterium]MBI4385317.1 PrgI family protein [Candidatus Parcubacteria bacterium]
MQFQVPQFIEVEDRVVGPLTWRQFVYVAGAGGVLFLLWFILEVAVWFIAAVLIGGLALVAAFLRVNGRPFLFFLASVFGFAAKPRRYIWRAHTPAASPAGSPAPRDAAPLSKIRELAWSLTAKKDQSR